MVEITSAGWREALHEITSRRTLVGSSLLGAAGLFALAHDADAKKQTRKKRCKNGAKRCARGCCNVPSVCSAATCFCTGNEGNCKSISLKLIGIIADALGIPAEQVGANPDQPLEPCPESLEERARIDQLIDKGFGTTGPVNWCDGGIAAGVEDLIAELTVKG